MVHELHEGRRPEYVHDPGAPGLITWIEKKEEDGSFPMYRNTNYAKQRRTEDSSFLILLSFAVSQSM